MRNISSTGSAASVLHWIGAESISGFLQIGGKKNLGLTFLAFNETEQTTSNVKQAENKTKHELREYER
jgi:hypothetical protein